MSTLPQHVQLPFLGERRYLHGTTLLDALLPHIPEGANVAFKFAKEILSDRVTISDADSEPGSDASATLRWRSGGDGGTLAVSEQEPSTKIVRAAYDEAQILDTARIAGSEIAYEGDSPFGFLATLVPLFKALLHSAGESGTDGSWMFSRLDVDHVPRSFSQIDLRLDGVLYHRVARSKIRLDGNEMGTLYYLWRTSHSESPAK